MSATPTARPWTSGMLREHLLAQVTEVETDLRSPYAIDGHPPMWKIAETPYGTAIAARPARTMERRNGLYEETDGVAYQEWRDGDWVGQGYKAGFAHLAGVLETLGATPAVPEKDHRENDMEI